MSPPSNRLEASENRKQQAVEDIMKTQMTKAAWIGLAVLVMAAGGASRARADELLVVTVPFAFTAGSTQLPAGTYTVRSIENDPSVLAIESSDGRQSKILLTLASTTPDAPEKDELVFSKHDGQYFLARIVQADGDEYEIVRTSANLDRDAAIGR
jgi:hypothetical protein